MREKLDVHLPVKAAARFGRSPFGRSPFGRFGFGHYGAWSGIGMAAIVATVAGLFFVQRASDRHAHADVSHGVIQPTPPGKNERSGQDSGGRLVRENGAGGKNSGERLAGANRPVDNAGSMSTVQGNRNSGAEGDGMMKPGGKAGAGEKAGEGMGISGVKEDAQAGDKSGVSPGKVTASADGSGNHSRSRAGNGAMHGGNQKREKASKGAEEMAATEELAASATVTKADESTKRDESTKANGATKADGATKPGGVRRPGAAIASGSGTGAGTGPGVAKRPAPTLGSRAAIGYTGPVAFFRATDSSLRALGGKQGKDLAGMTIKGPASGGAKKSNKKNGSAWEGPGLRMAAGISTGKVFPIAGEETNSYGSNGNKAGLTDYLPSLYFRFYPRESYYIQARLTIHSPQYTHSQLIDSSGGDTSQLQGWQSYLQYNTTTLKKLYYNDLELSFHYHLVDGLWLGAGVQLSLLSGAVGWKEQILHPTFAGGRDTVMQSGAFGLAASGGVYNELPKKDWRAMLQVDYSWRRWTLSVNYKQAIHAYTDWLPIGYRNHYRNSSLGIYLSYDLWERKRRK
ncbi:hypothetical protein GCM10011511_21770 [Puia dinghuensis]|uniref:Uncharacterized protein n=2 Tax=Puia dinghuensis TaxID=1792502 RepID=A0A8J2UCT5_9BACT|nr:hypothetical protein GCM10011511_21770 [Puia dinghuensis]